MTVYLADGYGRLPQRGGGRHVLEAPERTVQQLDPPEVRLGRCHARGRPGPQRRAEPIEAVHGIGGELPARGGALGGAGAGGACHCACHHGDWSVRSSPRAVAAAHQRVLQVAQAAG